MTALISCCLGVLISLTCLPAAAQSGPTPPGDCQASPDCAPDLAAGISDYQQRRYDTALVTFQRALGKSSDPRLLVLLGRTHFKLGDSRSALQLYERAQPQLTNEADRVKLEQYLAEARAALGKEPIRPVPPPELAPRPDSAAINPPIGLPSLPALPEKQSKLKPWMWVLIGGAAVAVIGTAVGVGVYYGTGTPRPDVTVQFP